MIPKSLKLKTGDTIFYPSAGVGVIESVEDVYLSGRLERCFVIRIPETKMTVRVPKANVQKSGIRPLLDGRKIKELFKILAAKSTKKVTGGNWTERCKEIERRINNGSCLELGEVVRDLTRWKKQSRISFEESLLLETASGYLTREVAAIEGITPEMARERIHRCIVGVYHS